MNPSISLKANSEKHSVAFYSVLAAVLLTILKIVVGIASGSLGILSEAAHSGLDLVAAIITLYAVRVSGRPADKEHTYGHGKFENLSALLETMLLLVTCIWIFYEVIQRLFFVNAQIVVSPWAFAILVISIMVDYWRSRALRQAAKKYQSQALEADALHFSTDIWSSTVVLVGLGTVALAKRWGIMWLEKADAVAAAVVAGIVIGVSIKLGRKSIDDLLDAVPKDFSEKVEVAARVNGVIDVQKVRIRRSGPEIFVDATLLVDRGTKFELAHDIATTAETGIRKVLPNADVMVHVEPGDSYLLEMVKNTACKYGLGAHSISIYEVAGRPSVDLHLEVPESLSVRDAHEKVTKFEKYLRRVIPKLDRIGSHIEPSGTCAGKLAGNLSIENALQCICSECGMYCEPHDIRIQKIVGELLVSFHCAMEADTSIEDAHNVTEEIERKLRQRVPGLSRVVIHVEPPEKGGNVYENQS